MPREAFGLFREQRGSRGKQRFILKCVDAICRCCSPPVGLGAAQLHNYRRRTCVITAAAPPRRLYTSPHNTLGSVNEPIRPIGEEKEADLLPAPLAKHFFHFPIDSHLTRTRPTFCRRGLPGFHRNPPTSHPPPVLVISLPPVNTGGWSLWISRLDFQAPRF